MERGRGADELGRGRAEAHMLEAMDRGGECGAGGAVMVIVMLIGDGGVDGHAGAAGGRSWTRRERGRN